MDVDYAFPSTGPFSENGLTMRDYFAAAALTGLIGNPPDSRSCKEITDIAYAIADAMMEARNG